ncbi:MAG: hypothetical protein NXH85_06670 [Pseudomonadaceae bacterium]|nr:hypothetical protein [Pseudomonadaceae bacterium]
MTLIGNTASHATAAMQPRTLIPIVSLLLVLLSGLNATAQPAATCAEPESVFVGTGEHGERVFSDTPVDTPGGKSSASEVILGCSDTPEKAQPQSSAREMLELALILAEDRRAESAQRLARQQELAEKRALALERERRESQTTVSVVEQRLPGSYPYRVGGRPHHYPHHEGYRPRNRSHSPVDGGDREHARETPDTSEPQVYSKRFPTR